MAVEELQEFGLERMDDQEIEGFLLSQKTGVLALPTQDAPYLLPISYGYDGESTIYFTYFVSSGSRKTELSEQTETASFLVYSVESMFMWESVVLTGTLDEVPEDEWESLDDILEDVWHPDIFNTAQLSGEITIYAFRIDEQSGIKHTGLPPGLDQRPESDSSE